MLSELLVLNRAIIHAFALIEYYIISCVFSFFFSVRFFLCAEEHVAYLLPSFYLIIFDILLGAITSGHVSESHILGRECNICGRKIPPVCIRNDEPLPFEDMGKKQSHRTWCVGHN